MLLVCCNHEKVLPAYIRAIVGIESIIYDSCPLPWVNAHSGDLILAAGSTRCPKLKKYDNYPHWKF